MSRANQWFVPGDGIAREVITADIQRYLGPDALVRPGNGTGEYEGRPGYWITAYRTLTSNMIQDLRMDSQRWQQEQAGRQETGRGVAYQDSRTHAARQHWGPTESQNFSSQGRGRETQPRTTHATHPSTHATDNYTTVPAGSHNGYSTAYGHGQAGYAAPGATHSAYTAPRTVQADYSGYSRDHAGYPAQTYTYAQQAPTADPYAGRPPPPTYTTPSPVAAPGYYIASDGQQYPLAQQPQQPPRTGRGRPA